MRDRPISSMVACSDIGTNCFDVEVDGSDVGSDHVNVEPIRFLRRSGSRVDLADAGYCQKWDGN